MKLAAIFSDNMVLQRDKVIYVFGTSDVDETIEINIDDIQVKSDVKAGRWSISLPPHVAGGPYEMTVSSPKESKSIKNVLYGEVWIDNGQSNIEFEIQNARGGMDEVEKADYPQIRYFKSIKSPVVDEEFLEAEEKLTWTLVTDGKCKELSGIGYYFAKQLHGEMGVPIGLVDCYQGGSSITCWMEKEVLEEMPEAESYLSDFREATKDQTEEEFDRLLNEYNALVDRFVSIEKEVKAEKPDATIEEIEEKAGKYPWPPPVGLKSAFRPGGLIETMFKRIAPFSARGILYYQGEEDAIRNYENYVKTGKNDKYKNLLLRLIREYRRLLKDDGLPVVIVQLPMYLGKGEEDLRDWAYLREAQELAVNESKDTMLVSLLDLGEYNNVHPVDKRTPGIRIAEEVLDVIYGENTMGTQDMIFDKYSKKSNKLSLSFLNTYGSIEIRDNELINLRNEEASQETEHLFGFEISSDFETWKVPASYINGEQIIIEIDEDTKELRYGFFNYGKVNVYNAIGGTLRQFRVKL